MSTQHTPGVEIEEVDRSFFIKGASSDRGVMIGWTEKGAFSTPILVNNWAEYQKSFGGLVSTSYLPYCAKRCLDLGVALYIVREDHKVASVHQSVLATVNLADVRRRAVGRLGDERRRSVRAVGRRSHRRQGERRQRAELRGGGCDPGGDALGHRSLRAGQQRQLPAVPRRRGRRADPEGAVPVGRLLGDRRRDRQRSAQTSSHATSRASKSPSTAPAAFRSRPTRQAPARTCSSSTPTQTRP
jgi:hypothetical protein